MHKKFLQLMLLVCLFGAAQEAQALKLYWKGGSGLFADQNKWWVGSYNSGVTAYQQPISTDTVYFTASAFMLAGGTISIDRHVSCGAMYWDAVMPNTVNVTSTGTALNLDIFGDLELASAPSLNFYFRGTLRMLSTRVGQVNILSRGQRFRLIKIQLGDTGSGGTIFSLQDSLYVDDPNQVNHYGAISGWVDLFNGQFVTNGHNMRVDHFSAMSSNFTTRGVDISNSTITIEGGHAYVQHWGLNFNATLAIPNYNLFNAANSKIHIKTYPNLPWYKSTYWGTGLAYNEVVSDAPLYMYGTAVAPLTVPTTFNILRLNQQGYFSHTVYLSATDLYLTGGFNYYFYHRTNVLEAENFHNTATCGSFLIFETQPGSAADSRGIVRRRTAGTTTNFDRLILIDTECDIAGGRVYNATNSIKRGYAPFNAIPFNWNLTAPVGQDYYFVARDSALFGTNRYPNWSDADNWDVWNGSAWVPNTSGCIPTPVDNVFFGANSFPAYTAGVIAGVPANKGLCAIDTIAYCHNITWLDDIKNKSSMVFVAPRLTIASSLEIFGSAFFNKKMRDMTGGTYNFYGAAPDTIAGDSTYMWTTSTLKRYSKYRLVGDNDAASMDWRTATINGQGQSELHSNFVQFQIATFGPNNRYMDSTQVYFYSGTYNDNGGTALYTGNTTFHLYAGNLPTPTGVVTINGGRAPNIIAHSNMNVGSTYHQTYWGASPIADFNSRKLEVQGDLRLMQNGSFYAAVEPTHFCRLEVTGSMAEYDGNVYLTAGKNYEFSPNPNSKFELSGAGNLYSIGDCQKMVKIKTVTGQPIRFQLSNPATADIRYTYLEGMNNIGGTVNVFNSIDGGNNTNFNFAASGVGVTYYWRRQSATGRFTGNWLDPGHWTTDPAKTHGDSLCIPTILDSVIIDPMSSAGGLGNDSIIINDISFCGTIWFQADKRTTGLAANAGRLYVGGSMILFNNMGFHNFSGQLYFVGAGDIVTNGTPLKNSNIFFNKAGGEWNLRDNFTTSGAISTAYGNVLVYAGRLNTNGFTCDLNGQFSTGISNQLREINLGASVMNMRSISSTWVWDFQYTNTLRFNAGTSVINFYNVGGVRYYRMGAGNMTDTMPKYNIVNFNNTAQSFLYNRSEFRYARFSGDMRFIYNNTFDSLYLEGGFFYLFDANTTQTLNSPHGKIIANGGPSAFVNIETTQAGQALANRSRFYKAFGGGFCLDFVKVKENRAEKATFAATPAAWQPLYSLLKFETGVNSDNINGTATGIWDFSLPIPYDPVVVGGTNFNLCAAGTNQTVPLEIKGNGPYIIEANWTNSLGASGMISDTIPDDDNDANTAYIYNLLVSQMSQTTNYTIEISTQRCGEATPSNFVNVGVTMPVPNTLVQVERFDTCVSNNLATWLTFYDDVEQKPMLSILDKLNAGDNDALGEVRSSVHFTPAVQRLPMTSACYPDVVYLRRWWRITPQNNVGAKVRLYFTAQELLELTNNTWLLGSGRSLYADSEIMVLKYSSGTVGVGPCQIVPHTLLTWNAATSAPFTSTTGNIGIEFEVSSFSAFVIVPIEDVILASQLLDFDAQLNSNKQVDLAWNIENGENLARIAVQRAVNNANFTTIGEVAAVAQNALTNYLSLDANPQNGTNYYRLQLVDNQGNTSYSEVRAVSLQNATNFELFPNPATSEVQIRSFSQAGNSINITVIDALGRTVISEIITPTAGNYTHTLPIQSLTPAVYMLRLEEADGSVRTARFVKK